MMTRLTPREYARKHDFSLPYTYTLIWEGRLNAIQRNGRWLVVDAEPIRKKSGPKPRALQTA